MREVSDGSSGWPKASKLSKADLTLIGSMLRHAFDLGWIVKLPRIRRYRIPEQPFSYLRSDDEIRRAVAVHPQDRDIAWR